MRSITTYFCAGAALLATDAVSDCDSADVDADTDAAPLGSGASTAAGSSFAGAVMLTSKNASASRSRLGIGRPVIVSYANGVRIALMYAMDHTDEAIQPTRMPCTRAAPTPHGQAQQR